MVAAATIPDKTEEEETNSENKTKARNGLDSIGNGWTNGPRRSLLESDEEMKGKCQNSELWLMALAI